MTKEQVVNELSGLQGDDLNPRSSEALKSVLIFVENAEVSQLKEQIKYCKYFIQHAETAIELINLKD